MAIPSRFPTRITLYHAKYIIRLYLILLYPAIEHVKTIHPESNFRTRIGLRDRNKVTKLKKEHWKECYIRGNLRKLIGYELII